MNFDQPEMESSSSSERKVLRVVFKTLRHDLDLILIFR